MRFLVVVAVVALTVYAIIDCARTPADEVANLPKPLWLVVVVLVWVVGPVLWLALGRERGAATPPRTATLGPVAPDDDPAFLRRLDAERRRQERERDHSDDEPSA